MATWDSSIALSQFMSFKFPTSQFFSINVLIITSRLRSNESLLSLHVHEKQNDFGQSQALSRVRFQIQFNSIIAPSQHLHYPPWDCPWRKIFWQCFVNDSSRSRLLRNVNARINLRSKVIDDNQKEKCLSQNCTMDTRYLLNFVAFLEHLCCHPYKSPQ